MPTPCTAVTRGGTKCKAWAVPGTQPPRCAAHRDGATVGAKTGNTNARTHGAYAAPETPCISLDDIIDDLARRQSDLGSYIDEHIASDELSTSDIVALLGLLGQNASRLGRLLRDRRALSGDAADGIAGAIAQALDELSTELGTDL